jgi:hypothetical protein
MSKRGLAIGCIATLAAIAAVAFFATRDDGGSSRGSIEFRPTAPDARGQELQAAVRRALARDVTCAGVDCNAPSALATRAARLASVVRRLDEAYARQPTQAAKLRRVPTSSFLHAALELRSCFELSAQRHNGAVEVSECRAPLAQYHARKRDLEGAVGA